jgi:hypothetical protein
MVAEQPGSPLGRVMLLLSNYIFTHGVGREELATSSIVSISKKDGDPTRMEDHRGITLISVLLKAVTSVVTDRISSALESIKFFSSAQAGFRQSEECVGQAIALYEILQLRLRDKVKTFVAFIDIKKAYDTVPHEALLRKMELIGISGKVHEFFRSMYDKGRAAARTSAGLSEPFLILRGVHQGCPASPCLFNIFINDIIDLCDSFGVKVVVRKYHGPNETLSVPGLMFADDVALLSPTCGDLQNCIAAVEAWIIKHEMDFNVKKCAIMGVGEGAQEEVRQRALEWKLHGMSIPIADSYRYLGIPFTLPLISTKVMIDDRLERARRAWLSISGIVRKFSIPLWTRIILVKALIIPVMNYGAELWGMGDARLLKGLQGLYNEILKALLGMKKSQSLASYPTIHAELGFHTLRGMTCAAKARALTKFASLRTPIALLCRNKPLWQKRGPRAACWVYSCEKFLVKPWFHGRGLFDAIIEGLCCPRRVYDGVREIQDEQFFTVNTSQSFKVYTVKRFIELKPYLKYIAKYPTDAVNSVYLCKARLNCLWLVPQLVRAKKNIHENARKLCPLCKEELPEGESLEHLMLRCFYDPLLQLRMRLLAPMMQEALDKILPLYPPDTDELSEEIVKDMLLLVLGGKIKNIPYRMWGRPQPVPPLIDLELCGWVCPPIDISITPVTVIPALPGPIGMPAVPPAPRVPPPMPGCLRVARYLGSLMTMRAPFISELLPQLEPTPQGMAAALPANVGEE